MVRHFVDNIGFVYFNRSMVLKLYQRKTSKSADQTATSLANPLSSTATSPLASSISLLPPQELSNSLRSTPEQPRVLPFFNWTFSSPRCLRLTRKVWHGH